MILYTESRGKQYRKYTSTGVVQVKTVRRQNFTGEAIWARVTNPVTLARVERAILEQLK